MKLYIETSVPNMLYADDAPEKRRVTEVFFEWLDVCAHELFVSAVVAEEIGRAGEPKRTRMRRALEGVRVRALPMTPQARQIARVYAVSQRCGACGGGRLASDGCGCKLEHGASGEGVSD